MLSRKVLAFVSLFFIASFSCSAVKQYKKIVVPQICFYAIGGKIGAIDRLLKMGISIDTRTSNGDTPLHCAARALQFDTVAWLLARGASADLRNWNFKLPCKVKTSSEIRELFDYYK